MQQELKRTVRKMSSEDIRRIYMISMLVIIAKKRYGCVSKSGIIKVLDMLKRISRTE